MDKSTKKAKITTGPAEDTQVTGVAPCGGAVDSRIRMCWDVNSPNITRMMCWMMRRFKILKSERRDN